LWLLKFDLAIFFWVLHGVFFPEVSLHYSQIGADTSQNPVLSTIHIKDVTRSALVSCFISQCFMGTASKELPTTFNLNP
jgi:hypothetical protein